MPMLLFSFLELGLWPSVITVLEFEDEHPS
jgi:hypothetical protein